jgi:putative phosphoribosyl transferase
VPSFEARSADPPFMGNGFTGRAGVFNDRREAGRRLAEAVARSVEGEECVVLGLPRGGVPVAEEVARGIGAPLSVVLVRKLGVPWQPELAFGAVSTGGIVVMNEEIVRAAGLGKDAMDRVIERERGELERREEALLGGRPPLPVEGRTAVLVDDGIATGATVRAALAALAERGVRRTVLACPVAPTETVRVLEREADEVVCLSTPEPFFAVGAWYRDFSPVSDHEVTEILARAGS